MTARLTSLRHELAETDKCSAILERKPRPLTASEQLLFAKLLERAQALAVEIREEEHRQVVAGWLDPVTGAAEHHTMSRRT